MGDKHPLVADDFINLGAVQFERGHYVEAEHWYRQALAINEGWYGHDNPETASTLSMLGRSLVFQHRYDEAVGLVEQALAIQEHEALAKEAPRWAQTLSWVWLVLHRLRRLCHGLYRLKSFAYDIYTVASPQKRVHFEVPCPTFYWKSRM